MQKDIFTYSYSAKENAEVLAIRKKYLPKNESKIEELKRLDDIVQASGMVESLSAGMLLSFMVGMFLFTIASIAAPINATIFNVLLCTIGSILFGIGLGAVSNTVLKKTSLV